MKKIFFDTDVILDLLIERKPHHGAAKRVFESLNQSRRGFTSALIIANVYYIVAKFRSQPVARGVVKKLMKLLEVLPVDGDAIQKSLKSDFKDFEDGIQAIVAMENKMDLILTRNIKDFEESKVKVMTPGEYGVNLS